MLYGKMSDCYFRDMFTFCVARVCVTFMTTSVHIWFVRAHEESTIVKTHDTRNGTLLPLHLSTMSTVIRFSKYLEYIVEQLFQYDDYHYHHVVPFNRDVCARLMCAVLCY